MCPDHSIGRTRRVPIGEPRETVERAIDELEGLLAESGALPELTVPFQIESEDMADLLPRLVHEITGNMQDEHRPIVAIDPGGVVRTEGGFRAWGVVTLGAVAGEHLTPGSVACRIEDGELVLEWETPVG